MLLGREVDLKWLERSWLEELSESKKTFRTCMDRMKTAITDSTLTYRKLYHEVQQSRILMTSLLQLTVW